METTRMIERYLDGTLNDTERQAVEERAGHDSDFHELIRLHREVNDSIRDEDLFALRDLIRKVNAEYLDTPGKDLQTQEKWHHPILSGVVFRIAALLIFAATAGVVLKLTLFKGTSSEKLYHRYYSVYESDVVVRSAKEEITGLTKAIRYYDLGKYAEALINLDDIIRRDRYDYLALLYRGLTCMETGNTDCAVKSFREIPDNWGSPFSEHRNWYLALALLKINNTEEAKDILQRIIAGKGYYSKHAHQIIKKLK